MVKRIPILGLLLLGLILLPGTGAAWFGLVSTAGNAGGDGSPDVTAPEVVSTTVASDGDTVTIVLTEAVSDGGLDGGEFDIDCDGASGANNVLVYSAGDGTASWTFTATSTVQSGETCNLDYAGDADEVEDGAGNDLAAIVDGAVTNNSTQGVAATYLVEQNFEGAGYDNGESWVENGTPNEDYTTTVLRGSQSCYITASGGSDDYTTISIAETSEVWFFLRYRTSDVSQDHTFVYFRNSTSNSIGIVKVDADGGGAGVHVLRASQGTVGLSGSTALAADTTYYIWGRYKTGTGSDGEVDIWLDTDNTKPGSLEIDLNTGNGTTDMAAFRLYGDVEGVDDIFDQVLLDDEVIGDVDN